MVTKSEIYYAISLLACLICVVCAPQSSVLTVCIFASDLVILATVLYISYNRFKDISLLFFNITYFLFLLSGATASVLEGSTIQQYINFSISSVSQVTVGYVVFTGIFLVDILYVVFEHVSSAQILTLPSYSSRSGILPNKLQRQAIILIFIVSSSCKLLNALEILSYSQRFGYVSLYTRESSSLPSVVLRLSAFFYFSFMLLLSANFGKKTTYAAIALVSGIEVIILAAGDRGEAVCIFLIIAIYLVHRVNQEPSFLVHKRTALIMGIAFLPVFLYILQLIKYLRVGNQLDLNFIDTIFEFFKSQGVSLNILAFSTEFQEKITNVGGNHFILGQLIGYLKQNVLFRTIFGWPYIPGNTIAMATSGQSFGSTISYIRSPYSYLHGIGSGTCFLSELFHDGSWIGLLIGLVCLTFLLRKMDFSKHRNWITSALLLNCMRSILVLPRGACLKWLTDTFSIPNLMILAVLFILSYGTLHTKEAQYEKGYDTIR